MSGIKRICVDPGHGNFDSGAVGQNDTLEKDINLTVSLMLAKKLQQQGFEVKLTRDSDDTPWNDEQDLQMRCDIANNWGADIFISIHCNSAGNLSAIGTEIWTSKGKTQSDILAENIVEFIKEILPMEVLRVDLSDGDSDKEANYYVLKNTNMIAFLSELAFISNLEEEQLLNDFDFQDKYTDVISKGVCKYFGINFRKENGGYNDMAKLIEKHPDWYQLGVEALQNLKARGILNDPTSHIEILKQADENSQNWLNFVINDRLAEKAGIKKQ